MQNEFDTEYLIESLREIYDQLQVARQKREVGDASARVNERIASVHVLSLIQELQQGA